MGTGIAWKMRNQSKADFLSGNGTQTGQEIPSYKMLVGGDKATFCPLHSQTSQFSAQTTENTN
jgi:hypothetical protein